MRHLIPVFIIFFTLASPLDASAVSSTAVYPYADFDSTIRSYQRGDFEEALKGFRELAENGDAASQYYLALMLAKKSDGTENLREAAQWFEKASVQGYAKAQSELGEMYRLGRGVPKDRNLAFFWLQKAANRGIANAQRNLGEMYREQTPTDNAKVIFWLEKAAAQNDPMDQFLLASIYQWETAIKDDRKAAFWLRKAANNSVAEAQYWLGNSYYSGVGVPQDYTKALYWFQKSDNQGNRDAPYVMADMYARGQGVKLDLAEEGKLLCKAAKRKNLNAVYSLHNGHVECLKEVAEQGYPLAQYKLGQEFEAAGGSTHDYGTAAIWYRKAAEQGESGAFFALGDLYARGLGVPQDFVLAKMLYILDGEGEYGRDHSSRIPAPLTTEQVEKAKRLAKEWKRGAPLPTQSEANR
jgi:TPR repeat protein